MTFSLAYMGVNPSYLSTLFKKETGITIHVFIQSARLDTAVNMLKIQNIHILLYQIHYVFHHRAILQSFSVKGQI